MTKSAAVELAVRRGEAELKPIIGESCTHTDKYAVSGGGDAHRPQKPTPTTPDSMGKEVKMAPSSLSPSIKVYSMNLVT